MTARLALLVLVVLIGSATPALGQAAPTIFPTPLEPVWIADPGPEVAPRGAAFSPDGNRLYLLVDAPALNLWAVLAWHWPELLAAVVTIWSLLRLRRVLRRRPVIGEPQCRRCDYLIRGLTTDRCPECGLELTPANTVIGRSRRPAILALLGLAVGAPAATVLLRDPLRNTREDLRYVCIWSSRPLYGVLKGWDALSPDLVRPEWTVRREVLLVFDLESGAARRTIRDERLDSYLQNVRVAAHGGSVYWDVECGEVGRFDVHTGRMTGRFEHVSTESPHFWRELPLDGGAAAPRGAPPDGIQALRLPHWYWKSLRDSAVAPWSSPPPPPKGLAGPILFAPVDGRPDVVWTRFETATRYGCYIGLYTDKWVGILHSPNSRLYQIVLSPDRRWLAGVGSGDGQVYVYDVSGLSLPVDPPADRTSAVK